MNKLLIRSFIIFWIAVVPVMGQEPVNHLKKEITISLDNIELRYALPKIGEAGNFQFSYNASIIPGDSIVSIKADNMQVERILDELLGEDINGKVLGNHVILLADENKKAERNDRKIQYTVSGYIYDAVSGKIISQASIYDVDERQVSATDKDGFYSLDLPSDQERMLSYSKYGYNDTLIIVRPSEHESVNIQLFPKPIQQSELLLKGLPPASIHERTLVTALVPGKSITASQNIQVIEERFFQVSLLPFIGSNQFVTGLITNRLSLNIFAGYSEGLRGLEIGGFVNIDRNDVLGIQIGGFGNIVGRDTKGLQLAGFFNVNGGSFDGVQVAGFSNFVMDTIRGVQLAGFTNALRGAMYGPQISGFANFTSRNVDGAQISGFTNIALGDVKVAQITGFMNVGLKDVKVAQVAGFANVAIGDVNTAQLAGFANYCNNVGGIQAGGFANIVSGTNNGIQVAGFLNFAKEVNGFQFSFINVSDTVSSGVPVGFLSFVRKGYHTLEFSTDEFFRSNISFKTGVSRFYNILTAGVNEEWLKAGYGIGSQLRFTERWKMSFDLTSSYILNKSRPGENIYFHLGFSPKIDFKVFKYLTLTAGPSLNLFGDISATSSEFSSPDLLFSYPLQGMPNQSSDMLMWIGGTVGFRF